MPFDKELALINAQPLTAGTDTHATTLAEDANKARVIDLGADWATAVGGLAAVITCGACDSAVATLGGQIEQSDTVGFAAIYNAVELGGAKRGSDAPFEIVLRFTPRRRYIRADLTVSAGTWTTVSVLLSPYPFKQM